MLQKITVNSVLFQKRMDKFQKALIQGIKKGLKETGNEIRNDIGTRKAMSYSNSWRRTQLTMKWKHSRDDPGGSRMLRAVLASKVKLYKADQVVGKKRVKTYKDGVIGVGIIDAKTMDTLSSSEDGFAYWRLHFAHGEYDRRQSKKAGGGIRVSLAGKEYVHPGSEPTRIAHDVISQWKKPILKRLRARIREGLITI